jgi:DNA primase
MMKESRVLTGRTTLVRAHYALLTTAVEVYHAALLSNPHALAYATSRGLDADTVREFQLGYAAGRQMWRECKKAFGERLRTVLVLEGMKDVGDLAGKAACQLRLSPG